MKRQGSCGFTLIEMLVVVVITAILASIGLPLMELAHRRAKEEELRHSLREIRDAIDRYKALSDAGSISRAADGSGYPPTLAALTQGVPNLRSPGGDKIYILRRIPVDPFSANPDVQPENSWLTRSYASPPTDPKPGKDVFDVYSASQDVGLNGVPYGNW